MQIPVFLIGCEGNHYLPHAMEQLKNAGFPAPIIVMGVNGREPGAEGRISFPFLVNQYVYGNGAFGPRITDIACADAHLRIYQNMIGNSTPVAIIVEDDVTFLVKNAYKEIKSIIRSINKEVKDWGFVSFANMRDFCPPMHEVIPDHDFFLKKVFSTKRPSYGTVCYAVSLHGAKEITKKSIPIRLPIDNTIVDESYQGFVKLQSIKSLAHHNYGASRIV